MKVDFSELKRHLLTGTSHMLPFVVAGGVLLALSVMLGGKGAVPEGVFLEGIWDMGIAGFTLFVPVLGGYIAYSIADRPALAPGMIGAYLANQVQAGFLGAIIVGFIAGYVVLQLKRIPLSNKLKALSTYFIIPIGGTFIVSALVVWVIGQPIAGFMAFMNEGLQSMAGTSKAVLGAVLGGMTAFDMGGPINKVATLFAQTQVGTQPWLMGGVGVAICVPPLGMALATFLAPKKYSPEEREAGKAAAIMGCIGITEGAIPFAANDPARVIPAIIAGGIVGNVVAFMAGVLNHAPWGGLIVLPVVEGRMMYVIAVIAGSATTALVVNYLKKPVADREEETKANTEELELSFD
ncbi:PTS fructose transporter subunit EIIC [Enterovibrio norvegicus]|uniref:PTS fructose transporter subunit EIIC n=2 Tax=Enterovibrio norvegicus TaxID=188144 RepID=A0A2N7L862_9GAMM|nr:PTS fructose transporter subunit EIIC [Enterovibrio norvegicus]MCC4800961.1 PTS fructose transporter subunit EIIC [Enterovibrio norvegicus]OEE68947.1 PTS fructose transporter subunit IIC [Enterovibrio norvegicus]OEF58577.1 PTS fructose transporter subunit IIC [Enterovibrio norvegicus]PMH65846.1 PTS fructose transporter subunit IIC [Enterovibrio norvegicus]PMI30230.1 PTS fructose transporter subunit IIC [Enterovibrio norvegicus]